MPGKPPVVSRATGTKEAALLIAGPYMAPFSRPPVQCGADRYVADGSASPPHARPVLARAWDAALVSAPAPSQTSESSFRFRSDVSVAYERFSRSDGAAESAP